MCSIVNVPWSCVCLFPGVEGSLEGANQEDNTHAPRIDGLGLYSISRGDYALAYTEMEAVRATGGSGSTVAADRELAVLRPVLSAAMPEGTLGEAMQLNRRAALDVGGTKDGPAGEGSGCCRWAERASTCGTWRSRACVSLAGSRRGSGNCPCRSAAAPPYPGRAPPPADLPWGQRRQSPVRTTVPRSCPASRASTPVRPEQHGSFLCPLCPLRVASIVGPAVGAREAREIQRRSGEP